MYRMYVDETGNADLGASNNADHRFLSLTGVIVDLNDMARGAVPALNRIKVEVLGFDPDEAHPLHRRA